MKAMTISEAARAVGVGVETIRFYERRRLIVRPSKLPGGGFRRHPPETIERVRFVRQAQVLGFSLREVQDLLSLRADPATDCGQVRERAAAKRADVERKIGELERLFRALEERDRRLSGEWRAARLRACSIMEALVAGAAGRRPPLGSGADAAMAARPGSVTASMR